jgi:hypothetical protein
MTGVAGVIVKTTTAVPVPPALVAPIVTFEVPLAVGVPLMRPVDVLALRPAGRPVALKLVGVLLPAI